MEESQPKKSLGQHWLHDQLVLEDIAGCAEIEPTDVVLEIGPGLGTLTAVLAEQAKQVIAVEFDGLLASTLSVRVPAPNVTVVQHDILTYDFSKLPKHYKVVANIPYYLTSNLLRVLSETSNPPEVAVLLIQKEVAERVASDPGDMSILSVTAQYFWHVSLGNIVPAALFTPPPKVDSQILIMHHRPEPLFENVDTKHFFRVVKAGFSQKRKTILNSLSGGLSMTKDQIRAVCEKAEVDSGRRAQSLTMQEWYALYSALGTSFSSS